MITSEIVSAIVMAVIWIGTLINSVKRESSVKLGEVCAFNGLCLITDAICYCSPTDTIQFITGLLSFIIPSVTLMKFADYSKAYIEEKTEVNKWFFIYPKILLAISIVYATVLAILFGKEAVDTWYTLINYAISIICMIYLPSIVVIKRDKLDISAVLLFGCYGIIPAVLVFIKFFAKCLDYSLLGASLALLVMYIRLQNSENYEREQREKILQQHKDALEEANNKLKNEQQLLKKATEEREKYVKEIMTLQNEALTKLQAEVMLSQIQPHFLYNTLASIAALCDVNPQKAKNLTIDFSAYLRGNLKTLSSNEMIPFGTEIDHTETYLRIEKERFGTKLNYELDICAGEFLIPALSLQPLVENAVKHGICAKADGGKLVISSFETESGFEITISDDGVGFEPDKIDWNDGSHIGIINTRERLSHFCNGELNFSSESGKGTIATIFIPKGAKENDNTGM